MSSGLEIERKFLVHKNIDWKSRAYSVSHVQQGYFAAINTVRVRIRDDKGYLTIKGKSNDGGLSRYEFEKEITLEEAEQLLRLCEKGHHRQASLSYKKRQSRFRSRRIPWCKRRSCNGRSRVKQSNRDI